MCFLRKIVIIRKKSKRVTYKIFEDYLSYKPKFYPKCEILFDEFKSVKTADGAMSFHMCDCITGQTIVIVEDRRLDNLIRYFFYYNYKAKSLVKYIVIDMYSPYVSLIKKMFPNTQIVIDKFHLTQLVSKTFNKTRIMIIKKHKQHYIKLKRYWKLLLK